MGHPTQFSTLSSQSSVPLWKVGYICEQLSPPLSEASRKRCTPFTVRSIDDTTPSLTSLSLSGSSSRPVSKRRRLFRVTQAVPGAPVNQAGGTKKQPAANNRERLQQGNKAKICVIMYVSQVFPPLGGSVRFADDDGIAVGPKETMLSLATLRAKKIRSTFA